MIDKKTIAVVGSTGAQGGALVRAILKDGEFAVRAITRNASSDKAQELKKLGAEVVEADVNNSESLAKAIEGCYGLYCVTFFWDKEVFSADKEKAQAKSMADAAKKAGIKHVVWSTLEDTRKDLSSESTMPNLAGKYKVPHFDAKAEADQYFIEAGVPTTFFLTSFYWENLINFGLGPKKGPDGKLYLSIPMNGKKMPGITTEDIGKCALGIFKHPEYINKRVAVAGEQLTIGEMAEKLSKALGKEVIAKEPAFDEYRAYGFPGAEEMGNMFQYYSDCEKAFAGRRNLDESKKLNPELQSFDKWLSANKERIPIA